MWGAMTLVPEGLSEEERVKTSWKARVGVGPRVWARLVKTAGLFPVLPRKRRRRKGDVVRGLG